MAFPLAVVFVPFAKEIRGVVVATSIPLESVDKNLPKIVEKKDCPVVVAFVRIVDDALRLVRLLVVPFKVMPENNVMPKILEFSVMFGVAPPEEVMFPEPVTDVTPPPPPAVEVATSIPLGSVARSLPRSVGKNICPVVVALVKILEEAFRLVKVLVVPLKVVPEKSVSPKILALRLMVFPPLTFMFVPWAIVACLLLKVDQSVLVSCPLCEASAFGKLMVTELVEVEILKALPLVPVATVRRERTLL